MMIDALALHAMADTLVGFAYEYDLPPRLLKLTRQLSAELFQAAADNCDSRYDEILGLKRKKTVAHEEHGDSGLKW